MRMAAVDCFLLFTIVYRCLPLFFWQEITKTVTRKSWKIEIPGTGSPKMLVGYQK